MTVVVSAHSSSAPAPLVASLPLAPAAADSAQHRHCSCRLIFHPPMCCFDFCLCPLRLYVRQCNTTPSPWWLLCLQWSVPPTTRTARAAVRVDRPTSLCLCHACASTCAHHSHTHTQGCRSRAERRYEKQRLTVGCCIAAPPSGGHVIQAAKE